MRLVIPYEQITNTVQHRKTIVAAGCEPHEFARSSLQKTPLQITAQEREMLRRTWSRCPIQSLNSVDDPKVQNFPLTFHDFSRVFGNNTGHFATSFAFAVRCVN